MRHVKKCLRNNFNYEKSESDSNSWQPCITIYQKNVSTNEVSKDSLCSWWGDPRTLIKKMGLEEPKPILLPVLVFNIDGENKAITDSTPIIRHLESEFSVRRLYLLIKLNFLNYVLEDFGDEWVTKYMFHYRWHFEDDIEKAGTVLPLMHDVSLEDESHLEFKKYFLNYRQAAYGLLAQIIKLLLSLKKVIKISSPT